MFFQILIYDHSFCCDWFLYFLYSRHNYLLSRSVRVTSFGPRVSQIPPKRDKSDMKKSRNVPFRANLNLFGPKPGRLPHIEPECLLLSDKEDFHPARHIRHLVEEITFAAGVQVQRHTSNHRGAFAAARYHMSVDRESI